MTGNTEDNVGYPDSDTIPNLESCEPPHHSPVDINVSERREELESEKYEQAKDRDGLVIIADDPGLGKTTSITRGAAEHDDPFAIYLPTHQNCAAFPVPGEDSESEDDSGNVKPEVDMHLRGPDQPSDRGELDESKSAESTEKMCPVYSEADDNVVRDFERIRSQRGTGTAHRILNLSSREWHPPECDWQEQWEKVEKVNSVVTVADYLTNSSVNDVGLNIVDDVGSLNGEEKELIPTDLSNVVEVLESIDSPILSDNIDELIEFIEQVILRLNEEDPDSLASVSPPELTQTGWVEDRVSDGDWKAETLAWIQHAYREQILLKINSRERNVFTYTEFETEDEAPFHLDPIFAAAVEAGFSLDSARRAIGSYPGVETCPSCEESRQFGVGKRRRIKTVGKETIFVSEETREYQFESGYHLCEECDWHEKTDPLTPDTAELPRAKSWIKQDTTNSNHKLMYRELPLTSELPDPSQTVILDATPVPEKYALLFGIEPDDVHVLGDQSVELNASVTQIVDGQYHGGTLTDDERGDSICEKMQSVINQVAESHDQIIVSGLDRVGNQLDLPHNAEWIKFHNGRGLDRPDKDAVVIVGSPHPGVEGLMKEAELLTMDNDDIRVGGGEHTDRDEELPPPVHRKYYYEDRNGMGRAAKTKHFTGLVGQLFRNTRENEIQQLAHRHRPIIADEEKSIYLLTNVPTELQVDQLASLSELSEPLAEQITGLSNSGSAFSEAIDLLEHCCEVANSGRKVEKENWFHHHNDDNFSVKPEQIEEKLKRSPAFATKSKRTISDYLNQLVKIGIAEKEYLQRDGYVYKFDISTSQKALLVINNNRICEVDVVQRLKQKIETDESAEWLQWADQNLDLPDG